MLSCDTDVEHDRPKGSAGVRFKSLGAVLLYLPFIIQVAPWLPARYQLQYYAAQTPDIHASQAASARLAALDDFGCHIHRGAR